MNKPSWRDELRYKYEGANDLSSSNGIDGLIAFIQDLLNRKARECKCCGDGEEKSQELMKEQL